MRWNAAGSLVPIIVSAAVSAAVAVVVTEAVAPPYAGAAGAVAAKAKRPAVSMATLSRTVNRDFATLQALVRGSATSGEATALQGRIAAEAVQLTSLATTVSGLQGPLSALQGSLSSVQSSLTSLQSGVTSATSDAAQAQTASSQATQQLTTLTPIVKSTAERLYDTCALTSDIWQRSFPNVSGNGATAWTQSAASETVESQFYPVNAVARCYATDADLAAGVIAGGVLLPGVSPDDVFTAPVP